MGQVENIKIANILFEIADLLELKGVSFKPRAYRKAAQNIRSLSEPIETYYKEKKLDEISGIGESIASKIKEILETGKLEYLNKLREEYPKGLQKMMQIQGLGPKKVNDLFKELEISSIEELEKAAKNHDIRKIKGFGKKTEQNILEGIKFFKESHKRFILGDVMPFADQIIQKLKKFDIVNRVELAGSIRRKKETIGDIDILIVSNDPDKIMNEFTSLSNVKKVLSKGTTKSSIISEGNIQVDLRVITKENFGPALLYFTGSKEHNIHLRKIANQKDMTLSEYGLRKKNDNKLITSEKEKDIYSSLGLSWIEPELREDRGEIEAAENGTLPKLITLKDIKGDLHVHTKWSEGSNTIKEMAEKATELNYQYIAICDHSKSLQIASGLTEEDFRNQILKIDKINNELGSIEILSGAELNIDNNGDLDISNTLLKDLDFVVASIHSGFKKSKEKNTDRIIKAMHNDYVNAIGHPTGRLIHKREGYELDLNKVFEVASELGIYLELNAFPERLDLSDINCRKAIDHDVKIVINTDSHNINHLKYMNLGISTGRRGWVEKKDVLNSLNLSDLKKQI